jgi:hypothetical protein
MIFRDFQRQPIAFDADGVILDFLRAFSEAAKETTGRACAPINSSYSLGIKFNLTENELKKTWETFDNGPYWQNIAPIEGAIEAIDKLQSAGFRNIHVVTAIPEQFRAERHANFRKLGFSPEAIHCVQHTTRWAKVPPITALRPFMFVDDRIEHLHSNPQVPLLVHIDHGDEQFPDPTGRVDTTVKSLAQWADNFLNMPEHWANIAQANTLSNPTSAAAPEKRQIRRRSKP